MEFLTGTLYLFKKILKRLLQYRLTGKIRKFSLNQTILCPKKPIDTIGLYLHIPFCKNLCPYCPYNRVEFEADKAQKYEQAVLNEINLFHEYLAKKQVNSLYIGGGTPTTMLGGLVRIVEHLRNAADLSNSDICIELAPNDMPNETLQTLRSAGVTMISIGGETFRDTFNEILHRDMKGSTILDAVQRAVRVGFDSVNVDLMFALPGQNIGDLVEDVKTAISCGVDQISAYPLFAFPYTELGSSMQIKEVTRPPGRLIRKMLAVIEEQCLLNGYERCAVWSFIKQKHKKFSSVSRHYYKGFGASAGSMLGDCFYVNTFDVDEYCAAVGRGKEPIALSMPLDQKMEMAYWLYWRIYEMYINKQEFYKLFGKNFNVVYGDLFFLLKSIGFVKEEKEKISITSKGAYWVHRVQNEYSLNNIQKIWGTCMSNPWPKEVKF
jgi:coproporphyrinogen III oxidase-like Fe-S oxidoreductase